MATVFIQKRNGKRGPSYAVRYADPISGRKKHYQSFKRYKQAQSEVNDLRAILDSGKLPQRERRALNLLTFSEVAESLTSEWSLRLKRGELSKVTVEGYGILLRSICRDFGDRLLCKISQEEIEHFRDSEIEKKSVISANRFLTVMKFIFKHGLKIKATTENPARSIKLLSEREHERTRFLLPPEIEKLVQASKETRAKYYLPTAILLGAEHGASRQEVLGLRWSDINFEYGEKGIIRFYRTKNKRQRTELLMPRTREALLEWKAHLERKREKMVRKDIKCDFVFCRIDGRPIQDFKRAWWQALDIAGIKNFHFHDLRHTFCSNLILSGANLKEVKEMIGHSDIKMTDRYSHLTLDHRALVQSNLSNHYSRL